MMVNLLAVTLNSLRFKIMETFFVDKYDPTVSLMLDGVIKGL